MFEIFTVPEYAPFGAAIGLVFVLAVVEIVGAFSGLSASAAIDSVLPDMDIEADFGAAEIDAEGLSADAPSSEGAVSADTGGSFLQSALAWLCVGRVPTLVILIVFLTAFGTVGYAIQTVATTGNGGPLPAIFAAILAFFAAVPMTRAGGLVLANVMPKEYSEAASQTDFIGRTAAIIRGEARLGAPAEAKVKGPFGKTHYILIEPDEEGEAFGQGTAVVIVSRASSVYRGVRNFDMYMAGRGDASDPQSEERV